MSDRYYIPPADETGATVNVGAVFFPYTFPFFFSRPDEVRYGDDQDETFTTAVAKTGRYGVSP